MHACMHVFKRFPSNEWISIQIVGKFHPLARGIDKLCTSIGTLNSISTAENTTCETVAVTQTVREDKIS